MRLPMLPTADKLASHVTRGPRYTSYPPAPAFHKDFKETSVKAALSSANVEAGISLYAHIPFCSSLCWYCGCNVQITRDRSVGAAYVETLLQEVALYQALLPDTSLAELSLGGGSPNFLSPAVLTTLVDGIAKLFPSQDQTILGIELDPRESSHELVKELGVIGFRRLSIGVQDFDIKVQKTINRHQSITQTHGLITHARRSGFTSIGVDLVYGLPGQTCASLSTTLSAIVDMAPDRIALFGYAHFPDVFKHQRLVEREPIPDTSDRADLLLSAITILSESGYQRVGFDHFALPTDPLAKAAQQGRLHRNFQGFTTREGGLMIACGVTAISDTGTAYWQNDTEISQWRARVEAGQLPLARGLVLSDDDIIRRYLIQRLLCDSFVYFGEMEERFSIDCSSYFRAELARLDKEPGLRELCVVDSQSIRPTTLGRELLRNVCMVFDAHLPDQVRGSTTI